MQGRQAIPATMHLSPRPFHNWGQGYHRHPPDHGIIVQSCILHTTGKVSSCAMLHSLHILVNASCLLILDVNVINKISCQMQAQSSTPATAQLRRTGGIASTLSLTRCVCSCKCAVSDCFYACYCSTCQSAACLPAACPVNISHTGAVRMAEDPCPSAAAGSGAPSVKGKQLAGQS